jgi:hypothetical protein
MKKAEKEVKLSKSEILLNHMIEVDNADIQEPLGKALAKVFENNHLSIILL